MSEFFSNYESSKLVIDHPLFTNWMILALFIVFAAITLSHQESYFLDTVQTTQLKGIAILLVVVGHLWTHVSLVETTPNLSKNAVSMFLLLSGYGLTLSWNKNPLTSRTFFKKRLSKVMVPYWITTIVILILDYFLLKRHYSTTDIVLTFFGINFTESLRHLDYARWFITFIIVYYLIFFLSTRYAPGLYSLVMIFLCSILLFFLRRSEYLPFGSPHHFVSFPIGCTIAHFHKKIAQIISRRHIIYATITLFILCMTLICYITDAKQTINDKYISLLLNSSSPILFCFILILIISLIGQIGLVSKLLIFLGDLSYEIYLVHGIILIKLNPIIGLLPSKYIIFSFFLTLLLIISLSYCLIKFQNIIFRNFIK